MLGGIWGWQKNKKAMGFHINWPWLCNNKELTLKTMCLAAWVPTLLYLWSQVKQQELWKWLVPSLSLPQRISLFQLFSAILNQLTQFCLVSTVDHGLWEHPNLFDCLFWTCYFRQSLDSQVPLIQGSASVR